tara:strand:+ start:460 stop:795 length:336 start_codon:yes stop_codon:yes gene_type:complete
MSRRNIESALKAKGITALRIEYMRSCPTPSGYASGWDIEITEETENKIYEANPEVESSTYMEFYSLSDVLKWVEELPDLSSIGFDPATHKGDCSVKGFQKDGLIHVQEIWR